MNEEQIEQGGFTAFALNKNILRGIAALGFEEPRPIQQDTIPMALFGEDILGLAQTGTGKTAAFSLPLLELLGRKKKKVGPRALIVAPTRELVLQITQEIESLAKYTNIRVATAFGGVSAHAQIKKLRQNPEILVACPGRLLDLHGQGVCPLKHIEFLVLDEADHMLDMGFLPDIKRIIAQLPNTRQNLLFSATMPNEISGLAHEVLVDPHKVEHAHSKPAETVDHFFYPVLGNAEKKRLLLHILDESGFYSAIVFTRTKHRAKRLAEQLDRAGHKATALQGNMSQGQRTRAMKGFRDGTYHILVATDIAARGIDVADVSHVINFDIPNTSDAYTHRIGRTGRAENEGEALTFVTPEDMDMVKTIEKVLGEQVPCRAVDGIDGFDLRHPPRPQAKPKNNNNGRRPQRRGRSSSSRRRR